MNPLGRTIVVAAAAVCAASCLHRPRLVQVRAVPPPHSALNPVDGLYADTVDAIWRRDYGSALELLQQARQRAPNDVRVLNALGVVYDKLGRFDLSARYYQQAMAQAPASAIVQANLAYSKLLAGDFKTIQASPPEQPPSLSHETAVLAAEPNTEKASAPPAAKRPPAASVTFVSIAQTNERAGVVARRLKVLGWTIEVTPSSSHPARTEIAYAAGWRRLATALANTIGEDADLRPCSGCRGVRLALGSQSVAAQSGPVALIRLARN